MFLRKEKGGVGLQTFHLCQQKGINSLEIIHFFHSRLGSSIKTTHHARIPQMTSILPQVNTLSGTGCPRKGDQKCLRKPVFQVLFLQAVN